MNHPDLNAAADRVAESLPKGGFSLSVWGPLDEVLRLERNWPDAALVPVWSTSKGPAAATILWLLDQAGLNLATPVAQVWPEFVHAVNFGQLLSHQAGLAAPEGDLSVFDHASVVASLATQSPNWEPGTAHGYHPRSFGFLLDEISLRLSGLRVGAVWQQELAHPLDVEFYFGLPESEFPRMAKVHVGRASSRPEEAEFVKAYMDGSSLTRRAFDSFKGLNAVFEFNHADAWRLGNPGFGGITTAQGLAKFYATLATDGGGVFSTQVLGWMREPIISGNDVILKMPTTFTAGFQKDPLDEPGRKLRQHYGPNVTAFGHPGAGGSIGWADPEMGWGVGLVLNELGPGVFPRAEILGLIFALYA
jgi:CubicO group peptidase (beta-lactamase class C family)